MPFSLRGKTDIHRFMDLISPYSIDSFIYLLRSLCNDTMNEKSSDEDKFEGQNAQELDIYTEAENEATIRAWKEIATFEHEGEKHNSYSRILHPEYVEEDGDSIHFYVGDRQYWVPKEYCKVVFKKVDEHMTEKKGSLTFYQNKVFVPEWFDLKEYHASWNDIEEELKEMRQKVEQKKKELAREILKEKKEKFEEDNSDPHDRKPPTPNGTLLSAETEAKYELSDGEDVPHRRMR